MEVGRRWFFWLGGYGVWMNLGMLMEAISSRAFIRDEALRPKPFRIDKTVSQSLVH